VPPAQPAVFNDNTLAKIHAVKRAPHKPVDTITALETVAMFDGDLVMAAADLDTSPQMILAAIVGNESGQSLLASYLRAYAMLKTFGVLNVLQEHVVDNLDQLPIKDAARTLTGIIQGMSSLTESSQAPAMNPYDALMKLLPPEERDALRTLVPIQGGKAAATQVNEPANAQVSDVNQVALPGASDDSEAESASA
jgi:hypothetical protein